MRSGARVVVVLAALVLLFTVMDDVKAGTDVGTIFGVNEPHNVVVNPLNPHKVAVSAANAIWLSNDEGRTQFAFLTFPFPSGPAPLTYSTCGDSSLAFDLQGRLFWTILGCGTDAGGNADVGIFVARINFDAGTFDSGFPVCAACGNNKQRDKQWIAIDTGAASPFQGNVYIAWSDIGSGNQIKFMRSTDGASTWSASAPVSNVKGECATDARFPHDAVDPQGNLYLAWHAYCGGFNAGNTGTIFLLKSPNAGADILAGTFSTPVQVFAAGGAEVTWNLQNAACPVPGSKSLWAGALQPFILPDPNRPGNVYIIADDDPNNDYCTAGLNDPSDVVFARSTDYGASWSPSTISHGVAGSFQVFATGAIDQQGNMFATWYDNRSGAKNAGGDFLLDYYATVSRDGGLTWSNDFRISDAQFDPDLAAGCFGNPCSVPNTLRMGEYNGAAAANGIGYVSFTGNGTCSGPSNCQVILFDVFSILGQFPDANEPNDSRDPGVATELGAPTSLALTGLTIHAQLDEDFFRLQAHDTGKLSFTMVSDNRASDLDVQVQDSSGDVIATATSAADTTDTETITIPAVVGQVYFVRVFAQAGQAPPVANHYSLSIVNTPAPVPFGLTLAPGSDSGRDPYDNVTNVNQPTVQLQLNQAALAGLTLSPNNSTPGYRVALYADGAQAGFASPVGGNVYRLDFASVPFTLSDGLRSITAKVQIIDPSTPAQISQGGESGALLVTVDTAKPAAPGAPDLVASSDSGGVDDDNVTTVQTPQFAGSGEANALVRLYAAASEVGSGLLTSAGTYQVSSSALADGVYNMTVKLEDLAGNVSNASAPLKVTIAHNSLSLPGGTTTAAAGAITIDLGAGTVAGLTSPSASGKFGIVGIPLVNIDANSHALTILGTAADDALTYTPTGPNSGVVEVGATGQRFSLTSVADAFTIDPLTGSNDVVTVMGSAGPDGVTANVDAIDTVQVNALLTVSVPNADVDRLVVSTLDGQDVITVNVADTVSAHLSVDGGAPAPAPNKNGDSLVVNDVSPRGFSQNAPGGPTQGSGVVTVSYPKTTNAITTIEYTYIEKVTK